MKKLLQFAALVLAFLPFAGKAGAQATLTLNDAVTYPAPRIGMNFCANDYYSCYIQKNILYINAGFENMETDITQNVQSATTTTFTIQNTCDQAPPNFFSTATYYIAKSATSGLTGVGGTITSNTGPNNGSGGCSGAPVFTIPAFTGGNAGKSLAFNDVIYTRIETFPGCTQAASGWTCSNSGSSTAALDHVSGDQFPSSPGVQNVKYVLANSSDSPSISTIFDSGFNAPNYYFSGPYTWCADTYDPTNAAITLTFSGHRTSGSTLSFSQAVTPTSTHQTQCIHFTGTESDTNKPATGIAAQFTITAHGAAGTVWIDNETLTSDGDTLLTAWRNQIYTNMVSILDAGSGRDWIGQNPSDFANETATQFGRKGAFASSGSNYNTNWPNPTLGLGDFLTQLYQMGIQRFSYVLPMTTVPADVAKYVDFISAPCSAMTAGSIARCTNYQTTPFSAQFKDIDISVGNETWNSAAQGQYINFGTYPQWNYLDIANSICAAAKADTNWNSSTMKCSATIQVGQTYGAGYQSFLNTSNVDRQEMNMYGSGQAITNPNNPDQWISALVDYWVAGNDCSLTGQAFCASFDTYQDTVIYEYNNNTTGNYSGTQTQLNGYSNGFGYGMVDTSAADWVSLGYQKGHYGSVPQFNFFTIFQNQFGTSNRLTNYIWGIFTKPGGSAAFARPPALAIGMRNRCVGTGETGSPITSSGVGTFAFGGFNGVKAESAVPGLWAFEYLNSGQRCIDAKNVTASPISFNIAGTNTPVGTCAITVYHSTNLNDNNETSQVVNLANSSVPCSTSQTIGAYTEETITWTLGSTGLQAPVGFSGSVKLAGQAGTN